MNSPGPTLWRAWATLRSCALCIVTLLVCWAPSVSATEGADKVQDAKGSQHAGWLQAGVGIAIGDALTINESAYRPGFDPVPSFSVGWAWRLSSFDLGLRVAHAPGAHSSTLDLEGRPTRLGDQVAILAGFRYRFVEAGWGGLYLGASPGFGVFMTTETLRGAVALNESVLPGEVAPLGFGFTFQSTTGFYTPLSEHLHFVVEAGAMGTMGVLQIAEQSSSYVRYRLRVHAGLEWRL